MAKKTAPKEAKKPCVTMDELNEMFPNGVILTTPGGAPIILPTKSFSTGSYGAGFQGPVTMVVDGKPVKFQASINLVVPNSKPEAVAA